MTIYLIVPAHYLRSQASLMRLWVTAFLRTVVKRGVDNRRPVNVILDECAQLGRLEAIMDMLTIGRGYGLKITAIFQAMAQLKKVSPERQEGIWLSNTTQIFFAINDKETAEYVSFRIGESTILAESGGRSYGVSHQDSQDGPGSYSTSKNVNENWQQLGRRLKKPEELTVLHPRVCITLHPGLPPIMTWLVRYYEKGFRVPPRMSLEKAAFDTACLFLTAASMAAICTAMIYYHTY
jgi:type IV secretion system protein VirD4